MADTPIKNYEKLDTESKAIIAANAKAQGITPQEYLTSRGGVYKSGYYGDTPEFRRLSDEAYAAAQGKGSGAINTALFNQIKQSYQDNPNLIEDPYLRLAYQNKAITIDQLMQGLYPDTFGKSGFGTPLKGPTPEPIGALADGTPIYGYGSDGKPVTDPSGKIYSTISSSDAITKFNSGANPIGFGSSTASTATATDAGKAERQSAYDLLFQQFDAYGLGALVTPLKGLIESGVSPAEFTIKLRETDAYKKRFAANSARINKGLRALSEAEYINLEDQYQDVMRRYGLPQEYYARGDMGRQEGFEKFIGGDVSPVELEDRVQTAQRRVLNAAPQVRDALTQFYGAEIGNGDILAYVLDPDKAIESIKRKVTAAEIGGGAMRAGLGVARARAEELGQYGVTGEQAITGFGTIASGLERGRQLSEIYKQPSYTQAVAETEVFNLPTAEQARRQRRKLGQLETAEFGGTSGITGGALSRERAGQY